MSEQAKKQDAAQSQNRPFPWRCPECGKKEVRPATLAHTSRIKYDGRMYEVKVPKLRVPRCRSCGELIFDNESDEQIAQALRERLGLMAANEIRYNREQLGMSQRELAKQIGVAVETISRWETGAMTQSRAMDRYLRVYFYVPEARSAILSQLSLPISSPEIHL